jgi:hypothetical protein
VAFAARPKLANSPAVSSGSMGRTASAAGPSPLGTADCAATADSRPSPAQQASPAPVVEAVAVEEQQAVAAFPEQAAPEAAGAEQPWRRDSPTMSDNPLAAAGFAGAASTPATGAASSRRFSHSPAPRSVVCGCCTC